MRFKKWPQLPGAERTRVGHHHGSHTPTSPEAVLLGKMAYHTKQIRRQCNWSKEIKQVMMWPHSHNKSFSVSLHACWINKSKKTVRFRLSGSICNVDKIYLFGKYALESSILCQCVPQFNTGSLASRLPQHINLWQGTHKGIWESKNTFLPSTHKEDFHSHYNFLLNALLLRLSISW